MLQSKHKARATRQAATICNNYISPQIFSQSPPIRSFFLLIWPSLSICSSSLLNASTFNTPISMSSETGCIYSFFFIIVLFIVSSSTGNLSLLMLSNCSLLLFKTLTAFAFRNPHGANLYCSPVYTPPPTAPPLNKERSWLSRSD